MSDESIVLRIVAGIIGLYFLGFLLYSLVRSALEGEFVIDRKLSVGNLCRAVGRGILVPGVITVIGFAGAGIFWLIQEDCGYRWGDYRCTEHSFAEIFVTLFAMVQLVVIAAGVMVGGYFLITRVVWPFILQPLAVFALDAYDKMRRRIPVRW